MLASERVERTHVPRVEQRRQVMNSGQTNTLVPSGPCSYTTVAGGELVVTKAGVIAAPALGLRGMDLSVVALPVANQIILSPVQTTVP